MNDLATAVKLLRDNPLEKQTAIDALMPALQFLFPEPEMNWSRGYVEVTGVSNNKVLLNSELSKQEVLNLFPDEKLETARYVGNAKRIPKETIVFRKRPLVNGQFSLSEVSFDADDRLCRIYLIHNWIKMFDDEYQVQVNLNAAKDFLFRSLGVKPTLETQRQPKYELPWGTVTLTSSYIMPTCIVSMIFN